MTNILADLETYAARVEGGAAKKIEALVTEFTTEEWPYIKAFISLLFQQETKDAVVAGIAAIPSGSIPVVLTAVGAAVMGSIGANATADAQTEIKAAQAAGALPQ